MQEWFFAPRRIIEPTKGNEMPKFKLDFGNIDKCIADAKQARLDSDAGPSDPETYSELMERLELCEEKLPSLYHEEIYVPYVRKLKTLGEKGFSKLLQKDPFKIGIVSLMMDIAQAIIQNGEGYQQRATDAFQEVLSDLYDGFLSDEDRVGVKKPDLSVIAPLAKWGCPDDGPYTWTADSTRYFGFGKQAAIVNFPPAHARRGLLAWAALAHETAGHDILEADKGLLPELANSVEENLLNGNVGNVLPDYWANRIDETASDVLGILNMGPAAGIATIGYFRALNDAAGKGPVLGNIGSLSSNDVHPVDILRGYLAASVTRLLNFSAREDWAKAIEKEVDRDLRGIQLGSVWGGYMQISQEFAKRSAQIVAETIVHGDMQSLEDHSLGDIQNWNDEDEWVVMELLPVLTKTIPLPRNYAEGIYAAHVVASAVTAALAGNSDIPLVFDRMLGMLKTMHDANPSWGPLYMAHPGDLLFLRVHETFNP